MLLLWYLPATWLPINILISFNYGMDLMVYEIVSKPLSIEHYNDLQQSFITRFTEISCLTYYYCYREAKVIVLSISI